MTQFSVPSPDLQINFYQRLAEVRGLFLLDALLVTVARADIEQINRELNSLVPPQSLRKVAGWGLRGEIVFPVPSILTKNPYLLAYYRLLLGFSQKQFYGKTYNFGQFRSMEERGILNAPQQSLLASFCRALCESAAALVEGVGRLNQTIVHELTLLTLGPQLRGGVLNQFGIAATKRVFDLIKSIVATAIISSSPRSIIIRNAATRIVRVEFANDPDICIREELASGAFRNLVAIEIKGGRDVSNVHNRIGEAEKSHQKARKEGFVECWTMVGIVDLDLKVAKKESPSTDRFYSIEAVTDVDSVESKDFREHLLARVGVSD